MAYTRRRTSNVTTLTAQPLPSRPSRLGESPVWLADLQTLHWIDIESGHIFELDRDFIPGPTLTLEPPLGALIPHADGGWIVAIGDRIEHIDPSGHTIAAIARVRHAPGRILFNDGKCDSHGRLYIGSRTPDWDRPGHCAFYRVDSSGIAQLLAGLTCSNGIAWNPDETLLYHIDSYARCVHAYPFASATGSLTGTPLVHAPIPPQWGVPDGLCVDTDGCLWIACYNGGRVVCWDPQRQAFTHTILVEAPLVTNCAFGGPRGDRLFITTASHPTDSALAKKHPHAGQLFAIQLARRGLPVHSFRSPSGGISPASIRP